MAGRRGAARGLALALAVAGLAALSQMSLAEPGSSQDVRTAQDETVTAVADPVAATPQSPVGLPEEQVQAITRAQRCLAELGYYKGEIDGKRGFLSRTGFLSADGLDENVRVDLGGTELPEELPEAFRDCHVQRRTVQPWRLRRRVDRLQRQSQRRL